MVDQAKYVNPDKYCNECGRELVRKTAPSTHYDSRTGQPEEPDTWLECPALTPKHWWFFWQWPTRTTSNHYGAYQLGVGD